MCPALAQCVQPSRKLSTSGQVCFCVCKLQVSSVDLSKFHNAHPQHQRPQPSSQQWLGAISLHANAKGHHLYLAAVLFKHEANDSIYKSAQGNKPCS